MGLSLRAYARHRAEMGLPGASLQAVQRARDRGRITLELDGTVADPERADREWMANTDLTTGIPVPVLEAHARAAAARPPRLVEEPAAALAPPAERAAVQAPPPKAAISAGQDDAPPLVLGASMSENAAAKVYWQAKKVELDFRKAAEELVPAADVRHELETVFRACRTRLLRVPSQARQLLPGLSATDAVVLENLIRETLEGLASGQGAAA